MQSVFFAFHYLIDSLFSIYISAYLIRFLLQVMKGNFRNQIAVALVKITNPLLQPARKFVPGYANIDWASILVIIALNLLKILCLSGWSFLLNRNGFAFGGHVFLLLFLLQSIVTQVLNVYFWMITALLLFSWFKPSGMEGNPLILLCQDIAEPLMIWTRRVVPLMAGLDLSPLLIILGIQVLQTLLNPYGVFLSP